VALEAAASKEPMKERPSGVDWADLLRKGIGGIEASLACARRGPPLPRTAEACLRSCPGAANFPCRPGARTPRAWQGLVLRPAVPAGWCQGPGPLRATSALGGRALGPTSWAARALPGPPLSPVPHRGRHGRQHGWSLVSSPPLLLQSGGPCAATCASGVSDKFFNIVETSEQVGWMRRPGKLGG